MKQDIERFIFLTLYRGSKAFKNEMFFKAMDKWEELRETIQELKENNTDKEEVVLVLKFLLKLMNVKDKQDKGVANCIFH